MPDGKQRVVLMVGGSLMPFCRFRRDLIATLTTRHGCRVICAYWGDSGDGVFGRFEMPGVTWVDLGGDHATAPGISDLRPLARLWRVVRRHRPDVVCCFNAKPIVLAPVVIRQAHRGARIVALMEGLGTALSFLLRQDQGRKRRVFRSLTRRIDRWVTLNPRDAAIIGDIHPDRRDQMLTLPGIGTDTGLFQPAPRPLSARRLIFVGRLVPEKGVRFFLDLARHLKKEGKGWRCAMAGLPAAHGGIAAGDMKRWVDEGVVESCAPVTDMPAFYRNASILIFPSEYEEGLPAVIMEAQASGLPCLVLDRPAVRGAIVDGGTGFLLPDRDHLSWARRLDQLSDPATFEAFSRAARRHACAQYDQDRTNTRLACALLDGATIAGSGAGADPAPSRQ